MRIFIRTLLFFVCCLAMSAVGRAQDTVKLRQYLLEHRYNIDLNSDHAFDMLLQAMKGKNLFVLGEGGSHRLSLYPRLKPMLLDQLARQNLKYYFIEFGRSTAFFMNKYINGEYTECQQGYRDHCAILDHERAQFAAGHGFKIVGIDFERSEEFNRDINYLFPDTSFNKLPASGAMLSKLKDTAYISLSYKKFQRFYRKNRKAFINDSAAIREELGAKYPEFRYFVTNGNTTHPTINRNGPMARNLLSEIAPLDTSSVYFLSIGMAHSIPKNSYSTVHKLYKSEALKNRVLVMNVHCENLRLPDGTPLPSMIEFLKNDIGDCFSHCAEADIVLFDLSRLPDEYAYMKKYGELLLFTKNQKIRPR